MEIVMRNKVNYPPTAINATKSPFFDKTFVWNISELIFFRGKTFFIVNGEEKFECLVSCYKTNLELADKIFVSLVMASFIEPV